jgi:4-amino-4-deoxy-L-arabinose transferase-like glycosyltransferase
VTAAPFGIAGARWRDVVVLALLAVLVSAPLIGWGLPHATAEDRVKTWATDELLPLEPLGEMHATFVESGPNRNYAYPWLHYFVLASAQAPYLAYLKLTGGMDAPSPEYPFGLAEPVGALRVLTLIGRLVSVLMGAGIVVGVYLLGTLLWDRLTGFVAGALSLLSHLVVYYSRTGNLDVPMTFWTIVGVVIFARILQDGLTVRRAVWLGVFTALALATKDQALVVFLPLGLALLVPALNRPAGESYRVKPLVAGLVTSIAVYAVATGMLVDPGRQVTHVYKMLLETDTLTSAALYYEAPPRTFVGLLGLSVDYLGDILVTMTPPVLLAAAVGILLTAGSAPRRLVLLLPIVLMFVLLVLPAGLSVRRYLLPVNVVLDVFAAVALVKLRGSSARFAWVPLLVLLLGWRGAVAADLSWAQHRDTRYAAGRWLAEHAAPGDRVAHFGPSTKLPPLSSEIRTGRVGDREDWKGDFDPEPQLRWLASDGPEFVVVIPDWTSRKGMPRSADCPPEVFEALKDGSLGYRRAAYFPTRVLIGGPLRRPPLDNPAVCPPVRIFARMER